MTLLVVDLAVPVLHVDHSVHELADGLNDESEKFISFFISFAVIGRYWLAHHAFFSQLARMDQGLISAQPRLPGVHRVPALPHRPARASTSATPCPS